MPGSLWADIDLVRPVAHTRVDFTPGMWVGCLSKPANRPVGGVVHADAPIAVWNVSLFERHLAWNACTYLPVLMRDG